MAKFWPKLWAVPLALLVLGAVGILTPQYFTAYAEETKSWTDPITSPFKKLGKALSPSPNPAVKTLGPEDDALSLKTDAKAGPKLFVAIARLYEQGGKSAEAEQQYLLALKDKPDDLPALLGYAHLKDSLGKPNEAIQLYQRAIKSYPKDASIHNNLGMCYSRQNRLDEAVASINLATQLEPKNPLYRNNLATLLVDQGKWSEALAQFRGVHNDAAAFYNMGYLLNKKGETQASMQYFALALRADPSMDAARLWVEHLQKTTAQARLPQNPPPPNVQVPQEPARTEIPRASYPSQQAAPVTLPQPVEPKTDNPYISYGYPPPQSAPVTLPQSVGPKIESPRNSYPLQQSAPVTLPQPANVKTEIPQNRFLPPVSNVRPSQKSNATSSQPATSWDTMTTPDEPTPRRLPPTKKSASEGPTLPGISYERPTAPSAPLPPPWTNSAIRPLPRVE